MSIPPLFTEFSAEIREVQNTLLTATADLTSPLGDLVHAQIKRSQPPLCAAVVLAVSMPQGAAPGNNELRPKRILLASALEMLHIALNVHRLLISAARFQQEAAQPAGIHQGANDSSLDRSFIGSTILAGDYCFSRAAQMAAQTDHARVVATFSLALQSVSEGLLREQFHSGDSTDDKEGSGRYDETRQLLHSGVHAAALLVDLPESQAQEAFHLSQELAANWQHQTHTDRTIEWQPLGARPETLPTSWQALHHWLTRPPIPSRA